MHGRCFTLTKKRLYKNGFHGKLLKGPELLKGKLAAILSFTKTINVIFYKPGKVISW
jgi:hypothetical protein